MRKVAITITAVIIIIILTNCTTSRKTAAPAAVTYAANMKEVVGQHCSPCHIPAKGGFKKAYDTYASVKNDIDEIIRRIELEPGTRGFMPFKKPKLSDSTIAVFKKWKADGMLEN